MCRFSVSDQFCVGDQFSAQSSEYGSFERFGEYVCNPENELAEVDVAGRVDGVWMAFGWCTDGVWMVYGWWIMYGWCMDGVWIVYGGCMDDVWMV